MNDIARKMSPEAQAAAGRLAWRFAMEVNAPGHAGEPAIVETLIGGRAFICEEDEYGGKFAVIIVEQDEHGPVQSV